MSEFSSGPDKSGPQAATLGHNAPLTAEQGAPSAETLKAANMAAASLVVDQIKTGGSKPAQNADDPDVTVQDPNYRPRKESEQKSDVERLKAKYGVSPRRYRAPLEAPVQVNEKRIAAAIPAATRFVNEQLAKSGSHARVTEAEVATNFLAEGGILLLLESGTSGDNQDGFQLGGLDTLVDRYSALKNLLPASIRARIEAKDGVTEQPNEKGKTTHSLGNLSIEELAECNAAMFAD